MSNLIIIQARLSSTRLPGKVLKRVYGDKTLLDIQIEKVRRLNLPFVLATTTNEADDPLVSWGDANDVNVFRGAEDNVLQRFIDCAEEYDAKHLIRICSDNPFLQLDEVVSYFDELSNGIDYISYCNAAGTAAIKTHWGLFVEGVSLEALKRTANILINTDEAMFYSEHVTNYIYAHPEVFNVALRTAPSVISRRDDLRFTIDTEEDLLNAQYLLNRLGRAHDISILDLVKEVDANKKLHESMLIGINSFTK
ncbi:cytidylyltransferase domain-containing protein [Roseivirga sp.]|uniref:cytidylyltransferase domain-containing protein n=1 Tax=Roseivirga sp. TaxID=1964215 RepID=UPI003B8CFE43